VRAGRVARRPIVETRVRARRIGRRPVV